VNIPIRRTHSTHNHPIFVSVILISCTVPLELSCNIIQLTMTGGLSPSTASPYYRLDGIELVPPLYHVKCPGAHATPSSV